MFVAEALFDFSEAVLKSSQKQEQDQPLYKQSQQKQAEEQLDKGKRKRSEEHDQQLIKQGEQKHHAQQKGNKEDNEKNQDTVRYLSFEKGEKILVQHAYQTGWWYGHAIKRPDQNGFFPSNYVKVGAKPPPPPPSKKKQQSEEQEVVFDPQQRAEWINKQVNEEMQGGPKAMKSDYYQGITGFKYVKINENNKNILKGNYVKFDVNTGLARVPVKDQAPTAKAVRQMGYYFDFHQWNQQKNKDPEAWKAKPDPSKKHKHKKLRLKGMGKEQQPKK